MIRIVVSFFLMTTSASVLLSQSLPRQGATVPVVFLKEVNSKSPSEPVIQISEDLVDATNKVVVRKGTPVQFNYTINRARRVGRPGSIHIDFKSVESVHGTTIPLTGSMHLDGENRKGKVLGISLGISLTIAPPMILYLLKKGGDVVIPANAKSVIPRVAQNTFEQ